MSQTEASQPEQPSVITLTKENSINIFVQYIEIAQKVGAYELKEADILKRASDVLIHGAKDHEINENLAINLLIQGLNKGQKHGGAFTLNDAALLHKVIQFIVTNTEQSEESKPIEEAPKNDAVPEVSNVQEPVEDSDDDLSSLSEPVPLRQKEI